MSAAAASATPAASMDPKSGLNLGLPDTAIAGSPDQTVIRRIVALLAPFKWQLLLVAIAVIVAAALNTVGPFLTRAVFDHALFPIDANNQPIGDGPNMHLLYWLVGAMIALPLVNALIGVGQTYLTTQIGNGAMANLRVALFAHLEKMELAFFTSTRTGDIQSRLANDVSGVKNVLTSTATSILQNVVTVIAAFISMVVLSWQLTIISLIVMPIFMVIQVRVGKRRKELQKKSQESLSDMTAITEESLGVSGVLLAKVFNRAESEVERYQRQNRKQTKLQLKSAMTGQAFFSVVSTFFGLTPAIVYLVAGFLINGGTLIGGAALSTGTIMAFTTLQSRLQQPLVSLMRVSMDVQTSFALFARLFEYLDMKPSITDKPGALALTKDEVSGAVSLEDVWFRYPATREESAMAGATAASGSAGSTEKQRGRFTKDYAPLQVPNSGSVPITAALTDMAGGNVLPPMSPALSAAVPTPVDALSQSTMFAEADDPTPLKEARKYLNIDITDLSQIGEDLDHDGKISDDEKWAIANLTLSVKPGQLAALVGPSGSGKTTLTYLIPRLHEVTKGAVKIDGHDVRDIRLGSLADIVGMVTQEAYLFHGTITENMRYARQDATDAEIVEACKAANIHDRIMSFADGYETITGERGFRLSGGEKQRLSIARVLIKDPKILILDEATSALDTATERLVQEALERAMSGRTTFAIAHRLSTIMNADVIFGIADGRLIEQGTHAELLAKGGLYARLYAEQFGDGKVESRNADAVLFTDGFTMPYSDDHERSEVNA